MQTASTAFRILLCVCDGITGLGLCVELCSKPHLQTAAGMALLQSLYVCTAWRQLAGGNLLLSRRVQIRIMVD